MTIDRLRAYGSTAALGTTALLASHVDAATVVDVNANIYVTGLPGIGTIGRYGSGGEYTSSAITATSSIKQPSDPIFRRASDTSAVALSFASSTSFNYASVGYPAGVATPLNGALLNSSDNWFYAGAWNDSTQRVWLQFQFGNKGDGTDFSIVKAVFQDSAGELTNASAASTAVPEPSSLALLSLGAAGLLIRRRKQAA